METTVQHEIKEIKWPGKDFLIRRAKISFDKLPAFFTTSYESIYKELSKLGIFSKEMPFAIYYSVDEQSMETDVCAAVTIPGDAPVIPGFEKLTIPPSRGLCLTYYGSYENMSSAYGALDAYLAEHHLQKTWMLEEYFSDPAVEKDPAKWKTNIYFLVK
jgi:effector-binding domain-containing protein